MASSYTHTTALKIYTTIASSSDRGVGIEQLLQATGLAGNTIRTYARWLEQDGAIRIDGVSSDAPNRPLKNVYVAVREPRPRFTDAERLKQIAQILTPYTKRPERWDKVYKGDIQAAIAQALRLTL